MIIIRLNSPTLKNCNPSIRLQGHNLQEPLPRQHLRALPALVVLSRVCYKTRGSGQGGADSRCQRAGQTVWGLHQALSEPVHCWEEAPCQKELCELCVFVAIVAIVDDCSQNVLMELLLKIKSVVSFVMLLLLLFLLLLNKFITDGYYWSY